MINPDLAPTNSQRGGLRSLGFRQYHLNYRLRIFTLVGSKVAFIIYALDRV